MKTDSGLLRGFFEDRLYRFYGVRYAALFPSGQVLPSFSATEKADELANALFGLLIYFIRTGDAHYEPCTKDAEKAMHGMDCLFRINRWNYESAAGSPQNGFHASSKAFPDHFRIKLLKRLHKSAKTE